MEPFTIIAALILFSIGTTIVGIPIIVIILLVSRSKRKKRQAESTIYTTGVVQGVQNNPHEAVYGPNLKEQRKQAAKAAREAQKNAEAALIRRAKELDAMYPLIRRFHTTEIEYVCKSKARFDSVDPEVVALQYLRRSPEEMEFYTDVVIPNAKNKYKYERAFDEEIAPFTKKGSILKLRNRKGQVGTISWVILIYRHNGKEQRRVEVIQNSDRLFRMAKNGEYDNAEQEEFAKQQRAAMTPSLRYDILARDGFRCQICGASQEDEVKLHVDHIIPVSKGGKTVPENLRTLCDACNIGKGAKIEAPMSDRVAGAAIATVQHVLR